MEALRDNRVIGGIWLVIRVVLGVEWFRAGITKVVDPAWVGADAGAAVTGFLQGALQATEGAHSEVQGWYAWFIEAVALPNAVLFSYLVAFGEVLVGLALVAGLFTRFAALMGVLMNLAFLWAGTSSSNPQMLVFGLAIVLVGSLAGYYGLDRYALPYIRNLFAHRGGRHAGAGA